MMQAVHAAAAPLIAKEGKGVYEKFQDAMKRIVTPANPLAALRQIKNRASK